MSAREYWRKCAENGENMMMDRDETRHGVPSNGIEIWL